MKVKLSLLISIVLLMIIFSMTLLPHISIVKGEEKAKETIKIAFLQPRTARILNFYGTWAIQGFHLGLEYATGKKIPENLNRLMALEEAVYYLPDGRKIIVKVFDTQGNPDIGVSKAKEAIEGWGADILAGCTFSSVAAKVAAVAKEYETLYFIVPAAAAALTQDPIFNKYIFRVARNGDHDAMAAIYYAVEKRGARTFAFMGIDYLFGWSGVEAFQAAVAQYPGRRTVAVTWPPIGTTDFRPYLEPILAANPDALGIVWAGDFGPLYRDLAALGVFNKTYVIMVIIDVFSNNLLNFGIPGVEGILEGIEGVTYDAYKANPSPMYEVLYKMMIEENIYPNSFLEGHPIPQLAKLATVRIPELWHPPAFATAQFIVETIKAVPDLNVERMIAFLEGLTLETPMGTTTIRPEDHQALRPMFIAKLVIDTDPGSETYGLLIAQHVETIPSEKVTPRLKTKYVPYPKTFSISISAAPLTGVAPLTVNFIATPLLGTPPYDFFWDFGDGTNSTEQNPTHIFTDPGAYNVTLIATDSVGLKSTSWVLIVVTAPPKIPEIVWILVAVVVILAVALGYQVMRRRIAS